MGQRGRRVGPRPIVECPPADEDLRDVRYFYLHMCFAGDELEACPACDASAAVKVPRSGAFVCFECGEIKFPDIEAKPEGPGPEQGQTLADRASADARSGQLDQVRSRRGCTRA